jgi:periplasmic protein TonB
LKQEEKYTESLDDLAFEGRNKGYGSYYLRGKYRRYLSWSVLFAVLLFLIIVFIPFFVYYFEGTGNALSNEDLIMIDYTFMPQPKDEDAVLLSALASQIPETAPAPIVVDSVPVPQKTTKEEVPPEENPDEKAKKNDTASAGSSKDGSVTGNDNPDGLFTMIDVHPRFPGGDEARLYFIRKNIRYPEGAYRHGIQGVVILVFVIEEDGSVSHIELKKGIGEGCDEEAARVVRMMPRWEPGKRGGRPVRVIVQMPIVFKIPGK